MSRPLVLDKQIEGKSKGFGIVCEEELTLVQIEDGLVKVIRNEKPSKADRGLRKYKEENIHT